MAAKQTETTKGADEAAGVASLPVVEPAMVESVSVDDVAELFKAAGYRITPAEQNGRVQLMSASQGIGFAVRFGNPVANAEDRFIDYTLSCVMQVQGELPPEVVASWGRTKRFARLSAQGQFLVLEMDVVVAGGVSPRHLSSLIELWDRLIQEFLLHLRNRPAMAASAQQAAADEAGKGDGATLQ